MAGRGVRSCRWPDVGRRLWNPPRSRHTEVGTQGRTSTLLVIAGPPGAGRTTVSSLVSASPSPSVLLRGDAFFRFLDRGTQTPWVPEAEEQNRTVVRASGAAAGQYAHGGFETIFDGVRGSWFLPTFIEATGLDEVHCAVLLPPVEWCVDNVATREGNRDGEPGTRYVHEQFERAGVSARHVVDEPERAPEEVAAGIWGRYRRGDFAYDARSVIG